MKKILIILLLMFILVGCGGHDSSSPPNTAPIISGLYLVPSSAQVGDGSGKVTINGYYYFIDDDANITTSTINWSDSLDRLDTKSPDAGINGYSSGTAVFFIFGADTTVASTTTFEFYVTDSTGLQSNKLTGTWTVYESF